MSNIVILHGNNKPIHDGHRALFAYAKGIISNDIKAVIVRNVLEWYAYLMRGITIPLTQTVTEELEKSLNDLGVPFEYQDPMFSITEEQRVSVMDTTATLIQPFRNQIILKRLGEICSLSLADILVRKPQWEGIVRGPDMEAFVHKSILESGAMGFRIPVNIYSTMIKDPNTGMKVKRDKIDEGFMTEAQANLLSVVGDVIKIQRPFYQLGYDEKLVQRLNSKYADIQKGQWKFYEIAVFEGGIFLNYRLELTSISFPLSGGGFIIYEDWNVFQK